MRSPRAVRLGFASVAVIVSVVGCSDHPTPPPPTRPPVALGPVDVSGVGDITQGGESENELTLHFTEPTQAAIGGGPGSFQVTLTDHAGLSETIRFAGTPSIDVPGSLGATATLSGPNVLRVDIVDSDSFNVEPITISGLRIKASPTAALGSINAVVSGCTGSLAGCTATNVLASPGSVVVAR